MTGPAMTREELGTLAHGALGPGWRTALARERGVNERTVRRWMAGGIDNPDLAEDVRAFLRSRRIISLPSPAQLSDRDAGAVIVIDELLRTITEAGVAIGWQEHELASALLSVATDRVERIDRP